MYEAGGRPVFAKPSQREIRRQLNAVRREQWLWMLEMTKCSPQEAIIDLGKAFGEFRRQLTYKAEERGKTLVVCDRYFPSSKLCSVCGAKTKRFPLSMRSWTCAACGTRHDRDLNAALNLKAYADSSAVSACGEFSASDAIGSPKASSSLYEAGTTRQPT
jgi:putative transposase